MESFEACDRAMCVHQNPTYGKVQSLSLEQDQDSSVLTMLAMVCEISSSEDDEKTVVKKKSNCDDDDDEDKILTLARTKNKSHRPNDIHQCIKRTKTKYNRPSKKQHSVSSSSSSLS